MTTPDRARIVALCFAFAGCGKPATQAGTSQPDPPVTPMRAPQTTASPTSPKPPPPPPEDDFDVVEEVVIPESEELVMPSEVPAGGTSRRSDDSGPGQQRPLRAVMEDAIYSPDPPQRELAATDTAARGKPVKVELGFCVDRHGRATDIEVSEKSGDPLVDQICVSTIGSWRFRPFMDDGKAVKACTTTVFNFSFD